MGIDILSNGKKQINPNIFTDYLGKRFTLVYCEPDCFIVKLFAKLIFSINNMFYTDDYSEAYYSRLSILPFNVIFHEKRLGRELDPGKKYINPHLKKELIEELDGIFIWAMEGLKRLKEQGYVLSRSSICEEALENYKLDHNPMPQFIEKFILDADITTDVKTLRSTFRPVFEKWLSVNDRDNRITGKAFWNTFNSELTRQGRPKTNVREINGKEYICNYNLNASLEHIQKKESRYDKYIRGVLYHFQRDYGYLNTKSFSEVTELKDIIINSVVNNNEK